MTLKLLKEQPTEEKPYLVADYPYGFKLRCQIRYWIETTKRGQRFCSQTLNPKTNEWNKPKKSTYSNIVKVGLDEKEHITYKTFSLQWSGEKEAVAFKESIKDIITERDRDILKEFDVLEKVREHISMECVNVTGETEEQKAIREAEQKKTKESIGKLYSHFKKESESPNFGFK